MEEMFFYPGCGLKSGGEGYYTSIRSVFAELGVTVQELPDWNCCGAVYPLSTDNLIQRGAPIRNLVKARDEGAEVLYVGCSMCYNVLKRAEHFARTRHAEMRRVNELFEEYDDYYGGVEIRHIAELLFERLIASEINGTPQEKKVAPYYGCTLLRPPEFAIPAHILEDILETVGYTTVPFRNTDRCCGAYHSINRPDITRSRVTEILTEAINQGAEALVLSCPLCEYNLAEFSRVELPTLWLTQAVGLALGISDLGLEYNRSNCKPFVQEESCCE